MACVCDRLGPEQPGPCYYCRNPRTDAERERFVRAGIHHHETPQAEAVSKDQLFEQERQRLRKQSLRKRR